MKKQICLWLGIFALVSPLSSCGKPSTPADTLAEITTDPLIFDDMPTKPELPDVDFGGEDFVFLNGNTSTWMTTFVVTAAEENGDVINDAIYRRNLLIEDQYNITIAERSTTSIKSDAQKSIAAGDHSFDIALMTMENAQALVLENALIEYEDIPYIQTDAPWWVQNSITDMSIGGHAYYAISLFDTTHYDGVRTLYFNKQMITDYSLENPYQLVMDGRWTLDKLGEMGVAVSFDVNGDGIWTQADQYGYSSWSSVGGQTLATGIGAILSINKDSNDMPYFDMDSEYYIERLEAVTALLSQTGFKNPGGVSENNGGVDAFKEGRILFYNETMGNAQKLRQMTLDFGILPAPKYDTKQQSYLNLGGNPYFMVVPITADDLERTGILMEALAFASMDTVQPAFYEVMLRGKVSRDNDSQDMLDIIFSTLSYYRPIALSKVNSAVTDRMWANNSDFASYFEANRAAIQSEIDKVTASFTKNIG